MVNVNFWNKGGECVNDEQLRGSKVVLCGETSVQYVATLLLKIFTEEGATTGSGSLFRNLTTLTEKVDPLILRRLGSCSAL